MESTQRKKIGNASPDQTLLTAMAEGDSAAFDELFERYSGMVLSFLTRLVSGKCDAEDLLQDTFLKVLTHAESFKAGMDFRPWVFTIARNTAYNALRKTKLRSELEVKTDLSDWEPTHLNQRDNPDPSTLAEREEQKARVMAALESLPAPHREILVLTMFERFTYEEASRITGDSEGTLRSRAFHALRKLRERMKD